MLSSRSVATSAVFVVVITVETASAATSTTSSASAVTALPFLLNGLEIITIIIALFLLLMKGLAITLFPAAMAVFAALMRLVLLDLTRFSFFTRRLRFVDLNLLSKLLLELRQVLVCLSIVLILSTQKTLQRANELRRAFSLRLRLFLLSILLEALKLILSARGTFCRSRKLSNRTAHRCLCLLDLGVLVLIPEFWEISLVANML